MTGALQLPNITAVELRGRALLLQGPPGSGKSSLALALIDRGGILIGDDAITVRPRDSVLLVSPPKQTAGLIEVRNVGLVKLPTTTAPAALILALAPVAPRFPLESHTLELAGVRLPLLPFLAGDAVQALRAEYALDKHGLAFADRGTLGEIHLHGH